MLRGTTIIVVIVRGVIYIGADSRVHDVSGRPTGTACKLVQVGNAVAGVAGVLADPSAGWRSVDLARDALSHKGTLDDKVQEFVRLVTARVEPLASKMRRENAALYQREAMGKPFVQAVFVESGHLRQVTLEPMNDGANVRLRPHFQSCDVGCDESYIALGHFDNLSAVVDRTPNYWRVGRVSEQIRALIQVEEAADRNRTGGAISLATIGPRGVAWSERGACK